MTRDIYRPFPEGEREEKLQAFAEFVKERDGVPDLATRTLSRREETLKRFRGTRILYPGTFDRALFDAQYRHYDKRRKTAQEILLLLTFIKFNNIEAFTVEKSFHAVERGIVRPKNDLELILLLEEHYHTKILLSAANLFGLNIEPRFEASLGVRVINTATLRLPDVIRYPLLLVAEFLGVIMLLRMLRSLREIFKAAPPLRDALEERLIDVLSMKSVMLPTTAFSSTLGVLLRQNCAYRWLRWVSVRLSERRGHSVYFLCHGEMFSRLK